MRERMREIIRAELDRIHPTDDAHRALELIIESSVRPSEVDGALKLTIIDHDGKPRTKRLDGEDVEFTLHDLLDELRVRYPVLFRPGEARCGTGRNGWADRTAREAEARLARSRFRHEVGRGSQP